MNGYNHELIFSEHTQRGVMPKIKVVSESGSHPDEVRASNEKATRKRVDDAVNKAYQFCSGGDKELFVGG